MRPVAEGIVGRSSAAAERDRRLVGIEREGIALRIGQNDRPRDEEGTVGTHADFNRVGHGLEWCVVGGGWLVNWAEYSVLAAGLLAVFARYSGLAGGRFRRLLEDEEDLDLRLWVGF